MSSKYDIAAIRATIKKKSGGGRDPTQFRIPKAEAGKDEHYRFYILPPYCEGDAVQGGLATKSMDNTFFIEHGSHYIENKVYGCPRVISGEHCELCDYGFSLIGEIKKSSLGEEEKKKQCSAIGKDLLASSYKKVNIYFPDGKLGANNPEDLKGKVKWLDASGTVFNIWWECLSRDDDGGDEIKPLPWGVFYDESASYLFDLKVSHKGGYNNYEGSEFLVSTNLRTLPIAYGEGLKPDREKIAEILAQRHDLHTKLPEIDARALSRIVSNLKGGGGSPSPGNGGFDHDEEARTTAARPVAKTAAVVATTAAPKATPATKATSGEMPVESKAAPVAVETKAVEGDWDDDVQALLGQIEG